MRVIIIQVKYAAKENKNQEDDVCPSARMDADGLDTFDITI